MGDALDWQAMAKRTKRKKSMGTRKKKKWWQQRRKDLVNSKNKKGFPLNSLRWKERGLRHGMQSGSSKLTNGQKIYKITALPMCGVSFRSSQDSELSRHNHDVIISTRRKGKSAKQEI
jgi:hypothetical protein